MKKRMVVLLLLLPGVLSAQIEPEVEFFTFLMKKAPSVAHSLTWNPSTQTILSTVINALGFADLSDIRTCDNLKQEVKKAGISLRKGAKDAYGQLTDNKSLDREHQDLVARELARVAAKKRFQEMEPPRNPLPRVEPDYNAPSLPYYQGNTSYNIEYVRAATPSQPHVCPHRSGVMYDKPMIYLYPTKTEQVSVNIDLQHGKFTTVYPRFNQDQTWTVTAHPDGHILMNDRSFYGLYWEALFDVPPSIPNGKIVPGDQVAEFLESALDQLGLTQHEANEMIVYWLPQLEKNPYNLIHFSFDDYEKRAPLSVHPQPDTVIRVMMYFKPLEAPVDIPTQILPEKPVRKGFTVVEWGGAAVASIGCVK